MWLQALHIFSPARLKKKKKEVEKKKKESIGSRSVNSD